MDITYLKSAFRKMRAHDKDNASNRLTPRERQAVIVFNVVVFFPFVVAALMFLLN